MSPEYRKPPEIEFGIMVSLSNVSSLEQEIVSRSQIERLKKSKNLPTFGEYVRVYRNQKKISQRQLAARIGVDHSTISYLEKGSRMPSTSVAADIARGLTLDSDPTLSADLIICLSKETDKDYARSLFGLHEASDIFVPDPNVFITRKGTPGEKAAKYKRRLKTSYREIATLGGINHSVVSRFISGKKDLMCHSFMSLVRGLSLSPEQTIDLFYSFGKQRNNPQEQSSDNS